MRQREGVFRVFIVDFEVGFEVVLFEMFVVLGGLLLASWLSLSLLNLAMELEFMW
jgi:hypothetical protein